MEEQLARSTVRLSDALEWTAPCEAVFEVVLLAMPDDQLDSVSSVLSSPADVLVRRVPYRPDLLHPIVQDGRLGNLDSLGFLGHGPEELHLTTLEVPIPIFPVPKARAKERLIVARRGRGTGIRGRAPRRQAKPWESEVLRNLLTTLTAQIDSMERSTCRPPPRRERAIFQIFAPTWPTRNPSESIGECRLRPCSRPVWYCTPPVDHRQPASESQDHSVAKAERATVRQASRSFAQTGSDRDSNR